MALTPKYAVENLSCQDSALVKQIEEFIDGELVQKVTRESQERVEVKFKSTVSLTPKVTSELKYRYKKAGWIVGEIRGESGKDIQEGQERDYLFELSYRPKSRPIGDNPSR
ncbi:MAG: hypothetical protein WCI72_01055 [archaeon]